MCPSTPFSSSHGGFLTNSICRDRKMQQLIRMPQGGVANESEDDGKVVCSKYSWPISPPVASFPKFKFSNRVFHRSTSQQPEASGEEGHPEEASLQPRDGRLQGRLDAAGAGREHSGKRERGNRPAQRVRCWEDAEEPERLPRRHPPGPEERRFSQGLYDDSVG